MNDNRNGWGFWQIGNSGVPRIWLRLPRVCKLTAEAFALLEQCLGEYAARPTDLGGGGPEYRGGPEIPTELASMAIGHPCG